jgi:hypothetical protein
VSPIPLLFCPSVRKFGHAIYYCQAAVRLANRVVSGCGVGSKLAAASQHQLITRTHRPANLATAASLSTHSIRRLCRYSTDSCPESRRNGPRTTLSRNRLWRIGFRGSKYGEHGSFYGPTLVFRSNVTSCRCIVGVSPVGP